MQFYILQGRNQVYYKEGITNKYVDSNLAWGLTKLLQVSMETREGRLVGTG